MSESTFARLTDAFTEVVLPLARGRGRPRIVAVMDEPVALWRVAGGKAVRLARPRLAKGTDVEARLPEGAVLRRTVRLPAAGRDYVPAILAHRLDRLTPWHPDQVVFGFRAGDLPDAEGQVAVELVATSRTLAEEAEAKLTARGLRAVALTAGASVAEDGIDLWGGSRDPTRQRVRRRVVAAGFAAFLVLAPACAGSFLVVGRAEERLAAAETTYLAARRELIAASGTGADRDRATALIAARSADTAVVTLLDRIATALPDDTVLRRIELSQEGVRLAGASGNAPRLIPLLGAVAGLFEVAFAAPVTRDADGRDTFEITAARAPAEAAP